MSKREKHGGQPQFIQPRASYELANQKVWSKRNVIGAFVAGALRVTLIAFVPVLLIVGTLNYVANGWHHFGRELLVHWPVTVVPLLLAVLSVS